MSAIFPDRTRVVQASERAGCFADTVCHRAARKARGLFQSRGRTRALASEGADRRYRVGAFNKRTTKCKSDFAANVVAHPSGSRRVSGLLKSWNQDELTSDRAKEHYRPQMNADERRSSAIGVHPCSSAAKSLPRYGIEFGRSAARKIERGGSIRVLEGANRRNGLQESNVSALQARLPAPHRRRRPCEVIPAIPLSRSRTLLIRDRSGAEMNRIHLKDK